MRQPRVFETYDGESQSHKWQVYAKTRAGHWLAFGPPQTRQNALNEVTYLKAHTQLEQPHAVPL